MLVDKRRFRRAARLLRPWVRKEPADAELRYLYARSLFARRKPRAARRQMEKAVELQPDHAEAWFHLGGMYIKAHQRGQARQALRRFIELVPNDDRVPAVRRNLNRLR